MPTAAPYWEKNPDFKKHAEDLKWNFPEQKRGTLKILGGNSSNFSSEVKVAEYLSRHFSFLKEVKNLFPDALKSKFPPLENLDFFKSTESGSFATSPELRRAFDGADFGLILGDLSKNSVTEIAVADLINYNPDLPLVITRDAVDLLAPEASQFIERENLFLVASLSSFQKLLRALYYPRPLLLSSPIFPVVETLHKFSLSYPVSILTFHEGKIIAANSGKLATIDLEKTTYSPLTLWSGELAARIAVYNLFNKRQPLESMLASLEKS